MTCPEALYKSFIDTGTTPLSLFLSLSVGLVPALSYSLLRSLTSASFILLSLSLSCPLSFSLISCHLFSLTLPSQFSTPFFLALLYPLLLK